MTGCLAAAQAMDLSGPTEMGRCETASFTAAFTADAIQTASRILFTTTLPNAGFAYVPGSGLITLNDGTPVPAEPSSSGLNLIWDLDSLFPTPYELPPGETATLEFALGTDCGTISGTLSARVECEQKVVPGYVTDSQPVEILPGAVQINKDPAVTVARVGDTVTWTITVENTGLGPIHNVVVTDTLGAGLLYVNSTPPGTPAGQMVTWELGTIEVGEQLELQLQAEVVACKGLDNAADVRFGCDDSVCFDTAVDGETATASIHLIVDNPLLEFTPPTIQIPYCDPDGATVTVTVTNAGAGPATDVRVCVNFPPALGIQNLRAPATWGGSCFGLPDLAAGQSFDLTFDVIYTGDWCAGGPSGTFYWQTIYENVCGDEFRPPAEFGTYGTSYDTAGPPSLSVALSGYDQVYICTLGNYDLSVSFSGLGACGDGETGNITVVVDVPQGFVVMDPGRGTWIPGGDRTGGTITWTIPPDAPLDTSIELQAPGTVRCGQVATLTATATVTDCCGCELSASSSVPIAIECYQLITFTREASPLTQEKCGAVAYTNTFVFVDDSALDEIAFAELVFTESAANDQDYVEGSLSITIDGTPVDPITVVDTTPGRTFEIQGINDTRSVRGHTLVVSYAMAFFPSSQPVACPSSYAFYDWASLNLGPDCATGDQCTEPCQATEVLHITTATPSLSVSITGLPNDFVDPCGTYDVTLTLTKTSAFDPHNVRLQLENLNYYIVDFPPLPAAGICPVSLIPTDYGTYCEWDYKNAFVGQPNGAQSVLQFQVRKRCNPGCELTASALFEDSCGYSSCSVSASDTPSILREPRLYVYKTPEVIYATRNLVTWTSYVTNGGAGPAYEVWVDDVLGAGLVYESSVVDPDVLVSPGVDHTGVPINGVRFRIPVISPGGTRTIQLTARLVACQDLTDEVSVGQSCGGDECVLPISDTSYVLIPPTRVVASSVTASPMDVCSQNVAGITIRNAGDPAVYHLVAEQTLPPGLEYVPGSSQWRKGGGSWSSGGEPQITGSLDTGYTLVWTESEITGLDDLRSRVTLEIEFEVQALCNFAGGDFQVQVAYKSVCFEDGAPAVGSFRVVARRPSLTVSKTQVSPSGSIDCGGNVTWQIVVRNTGPIPVPYVLVEDEMAPGFTYVSSSPLGNNLGSITTWEITDLPLNGTATLTLTAQTPGAGDPSCTDLSNTVRASWGCPPPDPCLTDAPASDTIQGTRTPTVSLSTALSPSSIPACGETDFTLTITNTSTATAASVDVRITLPLGLSYVPGTTEIDCGGGFVSSYDPTIVGRALTWYDENDPGGDLCAEIPPNSSVQVRFRVKADCYVTDGSASIRVWYYDCCETSQRTADGSCSIPRTTPVLTITKLPATVPLDCHDPNNQVTWTITVTNTGSASADWVRVEDTLGANLLYVDSDPAGTPMASQKWGWEFGPLGPNESRTFEIMVRLSQPANNCAAALRTNTAQAFWGCGIPDGNPNTLEGCPGRSSFQVTARATIPDLTLNSTDIVPVLTCAGDGNYTGQVQVTVRNAGDAATSRDFSLTITEATSGWSVSGRFSADLGGTLPIAAGGNRTITIPNWPVTCGQCNYTFTVTLDTENDLCECRENNNSVSRDWTITLPDLTVRRGDLTLTCAGDGKVLISGTVTLGNAGCGSALTANVPMRLSLRDGAGCTGTDLYTWTTTFTGVNIPAGGEQTFTVSHTFPIDLCTEASGCTVSLLIEADYTGTICECDGENNTLCAEFDIDIPDVVVVAGENLTLTCAGDGKVLISGTVTLGNAGCGSALTANVPMRLSLRDGAGCTGTDLYTWTTTFTGVNIPAGGEQTFTVSHTFPIDLCTEASGCTVSLLIEADYTETICECDGENNTLCVEFSVEIPDLAVTAVAPDVPDSCTSGRVEVTVANAGCVESPAGVVVRITGAATGEITLPAILAGETAPVTVDLNEVLPCGFHEVTATVDPDAQVCECSSANNALGAQFTMVDPDLTLTDLVVLCQGDGSFAVTATAGNGGTEAAPPSTVRIWVDGALFHIVSVPALDIGATFPISYVTPRLKCGLDHLFTVTVDEGGEICECNEGNNAAEALAHCPCPGLVTGKATTEIRRAGTPVPTNSPLQAGDLITYTLTVRNVGLGGAFSVDLWDELPAEFLYVSGSTSAIWPGGSSTADPAGAPGPYLAWNLSAELLPGEIVTLTFQVFVTSGVLQGASYTNTMGATGNEGEGTPIPPDSGVPNDDDPDDRSSVTHPAVVPALALDKAISDVLWGGVSCGPAGPVEPGDVIVYTVAIRNVGYGVAYNVDFTDLLPPGVEYDTAYGDGVYTVDQPATGPSSLGITDGSSGLVSADISATLAVGGTLTSVYRVRVLSTVSQGVPLVNNAVTTGEDGAGTPIPEFNSLVGDTYPDRDSTQIGVVEPGLALEKEIVDVLRGGVSIWPTPIVLWGDVIVYRVTVRNVGLGTAYNVNLIDELPFGVAYDTTHGEGTFKVDDPLAAGLLGIPHGATGHVAASLSAQINGGGTLVAVYRGLVTTDAIPGSFLTNLATVTGENGAGTPIPEFNPDVNDAYLDEDSTTIRLGAPALVTNKAQYCEPCEPCAPEPVDCDPCADEPIEVRVGSTVGFQLTVTNVGYSPAHDIIVEDHLPAGFAYVEESAVAKWPGEVLQLEPIGAPGPVLTWVTGLTLGPGERLTITFDAFVTGDASVGGEVRNVMSASGVDSFSVPIPADSSSFVPQDDDPEDRSVLRLIVRAELTGTAPHASGPTSAARAVGGCAALGLATLGGALVIRLRRTTAARGLGLVVLLLLSVAGWGLISQGSTHAIVLVSDPLRGGTLFGAGQYETGERVTLTALPSRGFDFEAWYEGEEKISPSPILEFIADRDRTLVARFLPTLGFVGVTGSGQGRLALLPTIALDTSRIEIRPRFLFGTSPWDLRFVAAFVGGEWRDAQIHFTGSWEKIRFGGGVLFNPVGPAYRSAYVMASGLWEDLRLGLRVTHYPSSGSPPAPYLLYILTLSTPDLSVTLRGEEREGLTFKDASVNLFGMPLCCGIEAQGTLSFTKEGFSYVRVTLVQLPFLCCGLTLDAAVTFTVDGKAVDFSPRWDPLCDACLTVYGDVLWDRDASRWDGLALYGYKIRCCFGSPCCPAGAGGYVEFLTAFDPGRVPGGFQEEEFEYAKVGFCGPGCCGGGYSFEATAYFSPTGGLFGFSRFKIGGGIPLFGGWMLTPALEIVDIGASLSLGWQVCF